MQEVKEKKDAAPCKPEDYELCGHFVSAFKIIGKACSDRVLVERLKELEKDDIVKRSVDQSTRNISYGLTEKGAELKPVFDQVHNWADKWA